MSLDELSLDALSLDAEGQHERDAPKIMPIKPYCLRIASIKTDDDCNNIKHRKYALNQRNYYERHVDLVRGNSKHKYHNDPEFRKKKLEGMKIRRDRIKKEKLEKKKMDDTLKCS